MHENILVIDDEPLILASIEKALTKVGYNVRAVPDITAFTDALKSYKADLIIMDLHMKGVETSELMDEAKKYLPSVKILFMSGSLPGGDRKNFLQKPFRIEDLRQKVRELLDE